MTMSTLRLLGWDRDVRRDGNWTVGGGTYTCVNVCLEGKRLRVVGGETMIVVVVVVMRENVDIETRLL